MRELFAIGVAGALGSLARHGVTLMAIRFFGPSLPWGTLAVNTLGSLVLGSLAGVSVVSEGLPPALRVPLTVGFLGAFTTFSTFSVETVRLAEKDPWWALANVTANLLLGLLGALIGVAIGRWATG